MLPSGDALAFAAVKAKNHFGAIVVLVILIAMCGGLGYSDAATYVGGEKATAHVDDCQSKQQRGRRGRTRTVTTCQGTWTTADGQRHSGEIEGAAQDDSGKDVAVRTNGDQAVVDDAFKNLWSVGAACLLTVVLVVYIAYLATRRSGGGGGSGPRATSQIPPTYVQHPQRPPGAQWPPPGPPQQHRPPGGYPPHGPYPPAPPYPPPGHPGHRPQQRW